MTARMITGNTSYRPSTSFAVVALVLAPIIALMLGARWAPATIAEGEATAVGEGEVIAPSLTDPTSTMAPVPTESPVVFDPIATTPAIAEPPIDAPDGIPADIDTPIPTEMPAVEPEPTAAPTPTTVPTAAVIAAAESTGIEIGTCAPALGSDGVIGQGASVVYVCSATIAVAPVPSDLTEIVLDWGVIADVTPGWIVELRSRLDAERGADEVWTPGAAPGLGVVETLGINDDVDGNPTDGTFSYEVHFDVRLTAPTCGGPVDPDVTVTPSVLPMIDGIPGWRRHGELSRLILPSLAVAAPAPALSRTATGDLDDANDPLRFSHADQTVDAGTLGLTVTSGYCGGWTVSISATDFWSETGDASFGVEHLLLTTAGVGPGAPHPSSTALSLSHDARSIVSASQVPLPAGAYSYSFNLTLTIPGGTPPGTYASTVTVTASAAP